MSKVNRSRLLTTALSVALAAATLAALPAGSASAAPTTTCVLKPQLRDITVNQGVGSYSPLVRGKEALVRSYLSLPSCATARGQSISVRSATLNVTPTGGPTTTIAADNLVTAAPFPSTAPYASAPAVDSPADPRFVIPGSVLAPAANTARYTATMTVTINYTTSSSATLATARFTTLSGGTAPITSTVEKKTNALRILVVPMGDPKVGYAQQFNATAQATTAGAMRALARILPVPDGTGDLASTSTAGIRYAVTPTIADITTFQQAGKFCGTAANFDGVAANLSTFLQSWNTNNPNTPADRVIGVVQDSLSLGGDAGCAEGMSKVGQPITWTRLVPDGTTPSQTGSTMAMEIAHTFGDVPLTAANADPFSRYHSKNIQADDTAPNRAYNVPTRQFLATDRTVLTVRDNWNDQTTLLEPSDWAFTLCALTPTPLPTGCAASTAVIGTAQNVGADPTFVISGVITSGPPTTADITESYFKNGVPRFNVDDASPFRLVQKNASGATVSDVGLAVNFDTSEHDEEVDPVGPPHPPTVELGPEATFTAAVPFDTNAERIVLEKNGVELYARNRVAVPEVTDVSAGSGVGSTERVSEWTAGEGPLDDFEFPDDQAYDTTYSSDISGNGKLVVFRTKAKLDRIDNNAHEDIYLRDVENQTTTLITQDPDSIDGPVESSGPSDDPVISADGSTVAFVSSAYNLVSPQPPFGDHLYVYDVESGNMSLADRATNGDIGNLAAADRPVLSANGRYVGFTSLATNLAPLADDDLDFAPRVYLRDLAVEGATELVSVRSSGLICPPPDDENYDPRCGDHGEQPGSVTDDGRYVSFLSDTPLTAGNDLSGAPNPGTLGAYVRDMQGDTRLVAYGIVSVGTCGPDACEITNGPMNGDVLNPPLLSPLSGPSEARFVVFESDANNLVTNDSNEAADVFVRDMTSGAIVTRFSEAPGGVQLNGDTYVLDVTPDLGCTPSSPTCANDVLMASNASNFSDADYDGEGEIQDVFSLDFATGQEDGPTLATVAGDGSPAFADETTNDGSLTNTYKPGGISDDGKVATFVSTAPNLDDGDTNNYADAFVRRFGGSSGSSGSGDPYSVTATGSNPDNLRIDLVFRCGTVNYPVAVALKPDAVSGTSATWSVNVDPSLIGSCPAGSGLVAIANDGFSTSESFEAPTQPSLESQPPAPSIYGPAPGDAYSTYLQYSTVTLDGTARDTEDGVLPGSSLDWFITPPGGTEAPAGTGTSVRQAVPAGGWEPGVYRVRLLATDSDGNPISTTSSFRVLEDQDNDGVPAELDRTADPTGCTGDAGSGDRDPSNAFADPDGDGVSTVDEIALGEQPCVVAVGGTAGATTLRIDPNPVPTSSGTPVTGYLTVANAPETQVLATSLRLKLTAPPPTGAPVTADVGLVGSSSTATLFTGKFSRQHILAFARTYNLYGRPITVRLTGYVSGSGPITATTTLTVKK